jgi:sugar transferase (PEP-CTERM/EpsH1 system associated)
VKILFLTSRLPYPPHRGDKLRTWNLIKQASREHEITLVSFVQNESERKWIADLKPYCSEIVVVSLPMWMSLINCVTAVPGNLPFQVAFFKSSKMSRVIREIVQRVQPDIVHTHLIRMAPFALSVNGIPLVLDQTDSITLYLTRFKDSQRNPIVRLLLSIELARMLAFEAILPLFAKVVVCSEVDRQSILVTSPEANIDIIENGIDLSTLGATSPHNRSPFRMIFTGNMSYVPNAHGIKYFVREVLPLILKSQPAAQLYIVGQNPPASVRALTGDHVTVTGFVADIYGEYRKSAVAVAPIQFGAGTQYKVLESLALGIPTVCTSLGVNGLRLEAGKDILLADTSEEFAVAILSLFKDEALRRKLSENSVRTVRERFSWDLIGRKLNQIYDSIGTEKR